MHYAKLDWELTEPQSVNSEFTGSWVSRDNRRFWVWDYLTNYGPTWAYWAPHPASTQRATPCGCARLAGNIYTARLENRLLSVRPPRPGALFTLGFEQPSIST